MKGTFKITLDFLRELGACLDGRRAFKRAFPDGGGYQEVLDRCAEEERIDFASWLFSMIGPTEDVRIFENEILDGNKKLFFAGSMDFKRSVFVSSIFTGEGIFAGEGIQAGCGIEAGDDFGVFAGLNVKISLWEKYAVVSASEKPKNLRSGFWVPQK